MQGGAILSVAFSHDASLLAASCWDKSVAIYETITWQRIRELSGHTGTASFVSISPGKKYALNRNRTQGEVGVCAVPSCGPGSAQARPATFVGCVALPPCCYLKSQLWKFFDALELCCNRENLVKKSWMTFRVEPISFRIKQVSGHSARVHAVTFSVDDTELATGSGDATCKASTH